MAIYRVYPTNKKSFFRNLSVNTTLIAINVVMWLVLLVLYSINQDYIKYFALQPSSIIHGQYLWTIITSMFSHVLFWHIFANMVTLLFLGGFIEKIIGSKRYLKFYLISGIFASLLFILFSVLFGNSELGARLFGNPEIFALGASGAVFGLAGLMTILIPKMKVLVFFVIPMPIWMAMVFFLGFFWILSAFAGLPIGNSAHLGGFLTGIVYGLYLRKKYPRKTEMINRYFSR
ncbi:MAG: rhomboid family intramembrane serine protease [Nanoarchaeota archaeon]|nr:rhomboid family intramembrane serine protease [Nanoarchaeota archaeon]